MKKIILLLAVLALSLSAFGCGGGGAGSANSPSGENPGIPSVVQLSASHNIAQTNASITLSAKVLDGNGAPLSGVPVTFTNLTEPFGVIKSALRLLGIGKPRGVLSATVATTDGNGIARVKLSSAVDGFATIQAEVNNGTGIVRGKTTVLFSSTANLPAPPAPPPPTLTLDVSKDGSLFNQPNDFILFKTTTDSQRFIRATVFNDSSINGKIITFGSDSTDVIFSGGGVTGQEIAVVADSKGQATVLAAVNPTALSQVTRTINITAAAADRASNMITLFLEPVVIAPSPASSLTASPLTVGVGGTSGITATVKTNTGGFAPDGTSVNFTATCGTVSAFGLTTGGIATGTFTAPATVPSGGICTVSGKVGGVTIGTADITVTAALLVLPGTFTINGGTGGTATFTIFGGTPSYTITSNSPLPALAPSPATVTSSGSSFTVTVPPGTTQQTVLYTIKDTTGISATATLIISPPASLGVIPTSQTVASPTTTATYTITGGFGPYLAFSNNPALASVGVAGSTLTATVATYPSADTTVTIAIYDFVGATVNATLIVKGTSSTPLKVIPTSQTIAPPATTTAAYTISGGLPAYTAFSSNPTLVSVGVAASILTATVNTPYPTADTTVTITVFDSLGSSVPATLIVQGTATLKVAPGDLTMTGLGLTNVTPPNTVNFTVTGGTGAGTYSMFSNNNAVIPSLGAFVGSTFAIHPATVGATTTVILTIQDGAGTSIQRNVKVEPLSTGLTLNPEAIEVQINTVIPFFIFGGAPPYAPVFSTNNVCAQITCPCTATTFTVTVPNNGGCIGQTPIITVEDSAGKTDTCTITID